MPPLPGALEQQFQEKYGLPPADAEVLTQERDTAFYFLTLVENARPELFKPAANLVIQKLAPWSAQTGTALAGCPVSPAHWLELLTLVHQNQISATAAYQGLFPAMLEKPGAAATQLAAELNLLQNSDQAFLEQLADEVLARFPDKVQEYRKGKKGLIGLFMGELMKASRGKADPKAATRLLEERLKGL